MTVPYILIVDDDPRIVHSTALLLRDAFLLDGVDVRTATTPEAALAHLDLAPPRAIVTDHNLRHAHLTGLGLIDAALARAGDTRAILMTGDDDPEIRLAAEARGAAFLPKPFSPADLHAVLADVCVPAEAPRERPIRRE